MRGRRIHAGLVIGAGLLIAGYAAATEPASPGAGLEGPPVSADGVLASLDRALAWYREARIAMRSATGTAVPLFSGEDEQTARRVVDRAFDAGRAEAALLARPPERPGTGAPRGDERARLDTAIRDEEHQLGRLRDRLRGAPPDRRAALQREVMAAANRLELDRARLEFMGKLQQFDATMPGADADLAHRIQTLRDAVPELREDGPAREAGPFHPAASATDNRSAVRHLLALQRTRSSLEDLTRVTAALTRSVDDELQGVQQHFKPIGARLRALASDPAAGATSLLEGQQEFQTLLQRGKLVAAVLLPLREESALLHRYATDLAGWQRAVDRESTQALRGLIVELAGVALALAVILTGGMLWRVAAMRYVADGYRQRLLVTARNAVVLVAIALVVVFHFTTELAALVTALGFAAAGVAFALQNVILAMAGYFSIVAPNGIRVGDHVSQQGPFGYVHGEVSEIGLLRIKLRELTGEPLRPSGRVVVFPNSVVFTGTFFKHPATGDPG